MREAYPRVEAIVRDRPPSGANDWNDALRAAQAQEQEEARASGRGRAPARDTDYHDR